MALKKHIPNFITLLNLFCGCIAITFVVQQQFEMAFYFVCLGIHWSIFEPFERILSKYQVLKKTKESFSKASRASWGEYFFQK